MSFEKWLTANEVISYANTEYSVSTINIDDDVLSKIRVTLNEIEKELENDCFLQRSMPLINSLFGFIDIIDPLGNEYSGTLKSQWFGAKEGTSHHDDYMHRLGVIKFLLLSGTAKVVTSIKNNDSGNFQNREIIDSSRKQYDVFISHASKDKLCYIDSLYSALSKLSISIFYDSEELAWGDNWKQAILDGVAKSEFAIVVISNEFFGREWTERELNELLHRQNENGQKIILPLLFELSFNDLKEHYPELEFIQSIRSSDKSLDDISILLAKELIKRYR